SHREGPARALQVPAADRVHRRVAENGHRQDPALQAARARMTSPPPFVEIDWRGRHLRIETRWVGDAASALPPVVFLHEGLGSVAMWKDFPQRLCDAHGLHGLVFSRYGYGRSTPRPPDERWPVDFMHRQAFEVLPALFDALQV